MSRQYLKAKNRNRWILSAAMGVSALKGYQNMTKRDVAKMAGVANGLIHHYFGTMKDLRVEVMKEAGIFPSVGQARKNGWDKPLTEGQWTVTKKKTRIKVTK